LSSPGRDGGERRWWRPSDDDDAAFAPWKWPWRLGGAEAWKDDASRGRWRSGSRSSSDDDDDCNNDDDATTTTMTKTTVWCFGHIIATFLVPKTNRKLNNSVQGTKICSGDKTVQMGQKLFVPIVSGTK
jgi:hypothetical protein